MKFNVRLRKTVDVWFLPFARFPSWLSTNGISRAIGVLKLLLFILFARNEIVIFYNFHYIHVNQNLFPLFNKQYESSIILKKRRWLNVDW